MIGAEEADQEPDADSDFRATRDAERRIAGPNATGVDKARHAKRIVLREGAERPPLFDAQQRRAAAPASSEAE